MSDYDNVPVLEGDCLQHQRDQQPLNDEEPAAPEGEYQTQMSFSELNPPLPLSTFSIFNGVGGFLQDSPSSPSANSPQVLLSSPSLPHHHHHHLHHCHRRHYQPTTTIQRPLPFPTDEVGDFCPNPQQNGYATSDHHVCAQQQQQQEEEEVVKRPPSTIKTQLEPPERSHRDSYGGEMSNGSSLLFYFLVFLAEILMFGILSLVLFWVVYYHGGFGWRDQLSLQFNFHPVLMICGFIFFAGHAMLVYRLFRCCNKLTAKILHTFLNLMAIPCIVVATIAVFDSHNLKDPPIPNLYSLHSWLGLVTIGLFALQVVVGFFSFWLLLCCEQGTAKFRSGLVPVHTTFGIITFMLAIATAVTGYTEKAFFSLRDPETKELTYALMENEAIIINTQAAALAALGIIVPVMVALRPFRRRWSDHLTEHL